MPSTRLPGGGPTRRGTLLILVAGLAAIMVSLSLAFIYKIHAESLAMRQMLNRSQARMMLNAAVTALNPPASAAPGTYLVFGDSANTWQIAWFMIGSATSATTGMVRQVQCGGGPCAGVVANIGDDEDCQVFSVTTATEPVIVVTGIERQ